MKNVLDEEKSRLRELFHIKQLLWGEFYVLEQCLSFIDDDKRVINVDIQKIIDECQDYKNWKTLDIFKGKSVYPPTVENILLIIMKGHDRYNHAWLPNEYTLKDYQYNFINGDIKQYLKAYQYWIKNEELLKEEWEEEEKRQKYYEKKEADKLKDRGVYGIYIDDELAYIGKTMRSFEERFQEHREAVERGDDVKIYNIIRQAKKEGRDIWMRSLINIKDIEVEKLRSEFNNRDVCNMEMALITVLQPRGNIEGVWKPYRYDYR